MYALYTSFLDEVIKIGKFPFKIEYKYNGKIFVIEDSLIATFTGFESISIGDKRRQWSGLIEGTRTEQLYIPIDAMRRLDINVGAASFYMNDPMGLRYSVPFPSFIVTTFDREISELKMTTSRIAEITRIYNATFRRQNFTNSLDDLYEQYGIRIINYEFSEPIVNSFH